MFFGLWSFGVWNFVFGTWFPLTAPASLSFKFKFKFKAPAHCSLSTPFPIRATFDENLSENVSFPRFSDPAEQVLNMPKIHTIPMDAIPAAP